LQGNLKLLETSMRKAFVTVLGGAATGFLAVASAAAQQAPVASTPGAVHAPHFSKARLGPTAKPGKSTIRRGTLTDQMKTDPRYQQMWDPCQVEG
jgi:hypothetical protein